jgi:hypothetical protein
MRSWGDRGLVSIWGWRHAGFVSVWSGCYAGFLPVAVLVAARSAPRTRTRTRACDGNGGGLGRSTVRVKETQASRVLIAVPVDDKRDLTIVEGSTPLDRSSINQQVRSRLNGRAKQADRRAPIGVRGEGQRRPGEQRHPVSDVCQFIGRLQALRER